jgi:serine/threonine protein kinase
MLCAQPTQLHLFFFELFSMGGAVSAAAVAASSHRCRSLSLTSHWKQFQQLDTIGTGGFAIIKKAFYHPKKRELAMKIIHIESVLGRTNGLGMLRSEYEALKLISTSRQPHPHPHLTNLHFAYHDYLNCYLVMDLYLGGDLRYYITTRQCFRESQIAFIIACLTSALEFIHSLGILHRDIKPDNILFDHRGYPKLTDFGISCLCEDRDSLSCTYASGTLSYLAPEVLTSSHAHGKGSDYWSLGVVFYEMLYLTKPWKAHCPKEFVKYQEAYYAREEERKKTMRSSHHSVTYLDRESRDSGDDALSLRSYHSTQSHFSIPTDLHASSHLYSTAPSDQETPLPASLTVPLNEYSAYGQFLSLDCLSILSGLLDIRLEKRLGGSVSGVTQFLEHPWWALTRVPLNRLLTCSREEDLETIMVPPFRIDVHTVQETIKWTNKMNTHFKKPDVDAPNTSSPANAAPGVGRGGLLDGLSLISRRMMPYSRVSPTHSPASDSNKGIIPFNFPSEVMTVLDKYQYVGPSLD